VVFPFERDIGISYVRLLLHDTMLEDDSYRTGTSTSPACEYRSGRETAEHFLIHCTRYNQIRKDTIEAALDIVNCFKNAYLTENLEVLLISPSIDGVSNADNNIVKYLQFEFLTNTKRLL